MVYDVSKGYYHYSKIHSLNICVNPDCNALMVVPKSETPVFNIWFSLDNLFNADINSHLTVCSSCAKEHTPVDTCSICQCVVPKHTSVWDTIVHYDTNYNPRNICKVCAYECWPKNVVCFCGKKVREVDMINLKIPFSRLLDSNEAHLIPALKVFSQIYYNYTHDTNYCDMFTNEDDSFYPVYKTLQILIQKGCTDCVQVDGNFNGKALDTWFELFTSSYEVINNSIFPNMFVPSIFKTSHSITAGVTPSNEHSLIEIKNPGKLGYIANYNTLF